MAAARQLLESSDDLLAGPNSTRLHPLPCALAPGCWHCNIIFSACSKPATLITKSANISVTCICSLR